MVDPNTRQGKRTPVTLKIKFKSETLEQFIERYAVDVSQGGIFIRTKEPLAVGTQMKFEFQLRDASPLIAGEGTVVWTRENDPSRPTIAPGMGVRFDRLAEGSQGILERILADKAKQAPQRPAGDTARPPLFTDTPTRVAPLPMQDALLGKDRPRRPPDEGHGDSHTPLPKPIPFHSDADEFPEEAFEEATKVRALDELIAKTAEGATAQGPAARRSTDAAASDPPSDHLDRHLDRRFSGVAGEGASGDTQDGPKLPPPLDAAGRPQPKLLDTSPSPRTEPAQPPITPDSLAKTRLGVEPARNRITTPPPLVGPPSPGSQPIHEPPATPSPLPSGMRAVAAEPTAPARMPATQSKSPAPILIFLLLLLAAVGAAVWFLVIRPRQITGQHDRANGSNQPTGAETAPGSGVATPGSAAATDATAAGSAGQTRGNEPTPELVGTVIGASVEGATVEIVGTGQSGPAPFTAKLEKGKPYKARVMAPGFAALTLDVKGGDDRQTAKLAAKPRVISIQSDPSGALIFIDSAATGHTTPFDIELTQAQAAKKTVRVKLRKSGHASVDRVVDLAKLVEDDTRMVIAIDATLTAQSPAGATIRAGSNAGSAKGSAHDGSTTGTGSPPPPDPAAGGSGQNSAGGSASTPPANSSGGATGSGSPTEPEPEFNQD